jgi:hypothetical protein
MPPVITSLLALAAGYPLCGSAGGFAQPPSDIRELKLRPTEDFAVTGDGSAAAWKTAAWEPLHARAAARRSARASWPRRPTASGNSSPPAPTLPWRNSATGWASPSG